MIIKRFDIFDRMKIDQGRKILERLNIDNIYDSKHRNRDIIYNDSQRYEKLSIIDKHDNYLIKRMENGDIELEINGRIDYELKDKDKAVFNKALDDFKLMKESKEISQNKDKTLDFFVKNMTFNATQNNKGDFVVDGVKQKDQKTIAKTVFNFFKENNYIEKLRQNRKVKSKQSNTIS